MNLLKKNNTDADFQMSVSNTYHRTAELSEALQAWERHIATEKAKFIDDYILKKRAESRFLSMCTRCNRAWTTREWCARCELEDAMI